jgi:hypothetical protein
LGDGPVIHLNLGACSIELAERISEQRGTIDRRGEPDRTRALARSPHRGNRAGVVWYPCAFPSTARQSRACIKHRLDLSRSSMISKSQSRRSRSTKLGVTPLALAVRHRLREVSSGTACAVRSSSLRPMSVGFSIPKRSPHEMKSRYSPVTSAIAICGNSLIVSLPSRRMRFAPMAARQRSPRRPRA